MSDVLRFSRHLPPDAINLAWIRIPPLSPLVNLSLVETGKYLAENIPLLSKESAGTGVVGLDASVSAATGQVYWTTYNADPGGAPLTSGVASYRVPRVPTVELSPSGFVVENATAEIRVLHPASDSTGVWRLRLQDGVVVRRFVLPEGDQTWLKRVFAAGDELMVYYSVPEVEAIPFCLEETGLADARVIDLSGVIAERLDEHTVQLPDLDLWSVRSLTVNGEEQIVHPSGQLLAGTWSTSGQTPARGPFTAWEPEAGRLTLSRTLQDGDRIQVSYRYREPYLLYEGYRGEDGVYHDLNLNPAVGHTYDQGRATQELLTQPIYLYLLPTAAYRTKQADGTLDQERKIYSGARYERQFLRWERTAGSVAQQIATQGDPLRQRSTYGHTTFGTARFVSDLTVDTLTSFTASGQTLANFAAALVLAKIYVTAAAGIEGVEIIDARVRGGGIPQGTDVTDPRLPGATRAEIESYWDVSGWDGAPAPLPGVLLVELPAALLDGSNNYEQFTTDEIEAMIRSHIAAGIQIVVRYV